MGFIPQTDSSIGVLTVLYKGPWFVCGSVHGWRGAFYLVVYSTWWSDPQKHIAKSHFIIFLHSSWERHRFLLPRPPGASWSFLEHVGVSWSLRDVCQMPAAISPLQRLGCHQVFFHIGWTGNSRPCLKPGSLNNWIWSHFENMDQLNSTCFETWGLLSTYFEKVLQRRLRWRPLGAANVFSNCVETQRDPYF